MKIKRSLPSYFADLETEHEINSIAEFQELEWIKELDNIKNHVGVCYGTFEGPEVLLTVKKAEDSFSFIRAKIGRIYGSGKELGLLSYKELIAQTIEKAMQPSTVNNA